MKTLDEITNDTKRMLLEEFGKCCNYCNRYDDFRGTCKWDDEPTRPDDGERCLMFEFDEFALKELQRDHLMATQFGMIDNPWKDWIRKMEV